MTKISVCLCMIVKNEERTIRRCLNSVKFAIDYVSICDTGSVDKTEAVIAQWCTENKIPFKIHHDVWDNFSHNRTLSYHHAKEAFPKATWLLLLDADMVLVDRGFKREDLTLDAYYVQQTELGTSYKNIRLIRAWLDWESCIYTHEFTQVAKKTQQARVGFYDNLWIDDRSDGGAKDDKHDRDIKLLRRGLVEDKPEHRARYMFYLASTFFTLGHYSDAVYWFLERINQPAGQFEEEMWYSLYRIGMCYERFNDPARATYYYMMAINRRPHRLEPYGNLASMYINRKPFQYYSAYMLLKEGLRYGYPTQDILFVEDKWYTHEARYWLACTCFFLNNAIEGRIIANQLLSAEETPANVKENLHKVLNHPQSLAQPPTPVIVPPSS